MPKELVFLPPQPDCSRQKERVDNNSMEDGGGHGAHSIGTKCVHGGERAGKPRVSGERSGAGLACSRLKANDW